METPTLTPLEWVAVAALAEHGLFVLVLVTLPWWGRALIARLLTGQRVLPWGGR